MQYKYTGEQTGGYSESAQPKPDPHREWECPTVDQLWDAWCKKYNHSPSTLKDIQQFGEACMQYGVTEGIRQERFKCVRPTLPSMSLIAETTTGIEPRFANYYKREVKLSDPVFLNELNDIQPLPLGVTAGFTVPPPDPFVASMCDVLEVYKEGDLLVCGYCRMIAESAAEHCDQQCCGFQLPEPVQDYRGPIKKCQNKHCGRDFDTLKR